MSNKTRKSNGLGGSVISSGDGIKNQNWRQRACVSGEVGEVEATGWASTKRRAWRSAAPHGIALRRVL
jgi:hypothetical protein